MTKVTPAPRAPSPTAKKRSLRAALLRIAPLSQWRIAAIAFAAVFIVELTGALVVLGVDDERPRAAMHK